MKYPVNHHQFLSPNPNIGLTLANTNSGHVLFLRTLNQRDEQGSESAYELGSRYLIVTSNLEVEKTIKPLCLSLFPSKNREASKACIYHTDILSKWPDDHRSRYIYFQSRRSID